MKFNYTLTDDIGQKEKGTINASSKEAAQKKLQEKGKIILSVTEAGNGKLWIFGKPSMGSQDKMMFVKNLTTMVKVGITITESFELLADQAKKKSHKKMYEDILDMIKTGQSLGKALRKYDYLFGELFINMIATGEESGNLEKVLEYLDIQMEKEYDIRKKVLSAFIYPAVIISITLLMAIGIVIFIMPKITKIFDNFDIQLPLPTRILIGSSNLITEQPLLVTGITAGTIGFLFFIFKLKALKPFWHKIIINIPVFGKILIAANVARFARTSNSLLQASVPIAEGLKTTGNMIGNNEYKKALYEASEKVEKGGKVGESLEPYEKLFPTLATKMLYIGEKTGTLEITTQRIAELYEREVDTKTKNLSVLIEPLLLVFMAGLVGGIAMSIILPIYQLPNLLNA